MKELTHNQLLTVFTAVASPEAVDKAAKRMANFRPAVAEKNWLDYGVSEGFYATREIQFEGRSVAVVWFHESPDGGLIINAIGSTEDNLNFPVIVAGVDNIAVLHKSKYIRFDTARLGLIKQAAKYGYDICAISMRKMRKQNV